MVVDLMRSPAATIGLLALAVAPAALAPAHALGPTAPFTPPGAASAPTAAAAAAASLSATFNVAGLTGVRLGAAPLALIDGQWHRQGTQVRGARLAAVTRHDATLHHPDGRAERLPLLPPGGTAASAPEPRSARP